MPILLVASRVNVELVIPEVVEVVLMSTNVPPRATTVILRQHVPTRLVASRVHVRRDIPVTEKLVLTLKNVKRDDIIVI